jgi:hypothetical protein
MGLAGMKYNDDSEKIMTDGLSERQQQYQNKLDELSALEEAEALRIGRLVIETGLADVRATKTELKAGFAAMANRFPARTSSRLLKARQAAARLQPNV